jgi:hypothetical protein
VATASTGIPPSAPAGGVPPSGAPGAASWVDDPGVAGASGLAAIGPSAEDDPEEAASGVTPAAASGDGGLFRGGELEPQPASQIIEPTRTTVGKSLTALASVVAPNQQRRVEGRL